MKKKNEVPNEKNEKKEREVLTQSDFGEPGREEREYGEGEPEECIERMSKSSQESVECQKEEEQKDTVADDDTVQAEERNEGGQPGSIAKRKLRDEIACFCVSESREIQSFAFTINLEKTFACQSGKSQVTVLCQTKSCFADGSLVATGKNRWYGEKTDKQSYGECDENSDFEINRCTEEIGGTGEKKDYESQECSGKDKWREECATESKQKNKPTERDKRQSEENEPSIGFFYARKEFHHIHIVYNKNGVCPNTN